MQALETSYHGYRFRSRLEARWAVVFDALDVRYEYEKEGFHFPGVGNYLPDFWLPESQTWIEIKGQAPTDQEIEKAKALAKQSDAPVYLLVGIPTPTRAEYCWAVQFEANTCLSVFWISAWRQIRSGWIDLSDLLQRIFPYPRTLDPRTGYAHLKTLNAALDAGRSARFEYGASGALSPL